MDDFILILYLVGGVLMLLTSPLPGQSIGWRVFSAVGGLALIVWGGWVFLFGGWYLISYYVVAMPILVAVGNVVTMFKTRNQPEPSSYGPPTPGIAPYGPPQGYAPQPPYGAGPQQPHPGAGPQYGPPPQGYPPHPPQQGPYPPQQHPGPYPPQPPHQQGSWPPAHP